jgi:hypothetical protein
MLRTGAPESNATPNAWIGLVKEIPDVLGNPAPMTPQMVMRRISAFSPFLLIYLWCLSLGLTELHKVLEPLLEHYCCIVAQLQDNAAGHTSYISRASYLRWEPGATSRLCLG